MAKAHAALVDEVEEQLEDSSNGVWSAGIVANALDQALRELSSYDPYVFLLTREFESRTGLDTAGTAGSLTDTTESQFLAADVGKVIFNVTDNTWAIVVTFSSTSVLVLSRDIMDTNEQYVMYNQDCWNQRQIYLGDIDDYVGPNFGVDSIEYPTRGWPPNKRNFTLDRDVLTVIYDGSIPDSKQENLGGRVVDVDIWIKRQHWVSRMADLAGAVDLVAGYSRGATQIVVDALTDSEVIKAGQEFTIATLRGRYRCTADVTVATNEAIVNFWPPLENDLENDKVVTFVGSTLSTEQERVLVDLCVGRLAVTKAALYLQQISAAITSISSGNTALGLVAAKVLRQVTDAASARTAADLMPAIILEANTEIDKMAVEVTKAAAALDNAGATTNRVNKGANVPGQYATEAAQHINTARGRVETAQGFLSEVNGNLAQVRVQLETGAAELAGAQGSVNEALGYLEKASVELQTGTAAREIRIWGQNKTSQAIRDIRKPLLPKQRRTYSRV